MHDNQEVINYYTSSKWDYRIYNGSLTDLSMHYGLWGHGTQTHRQALSNENRVIAATAGITPDDYVIDLGCGYGSSAVWLASEIGCRVLGINCDENQVIAARNLARKKRVDHLVAFSTADFHRTKLPGAIFDVAIAIESISHSSNKMAVLKETMRVLKPGGRLAVADGFFAKPRSKITAVEHQIANSCFQGVRIPSLPERQEFEAWLRNLGFSRVSWLDKTPQILRTAKRVHRLGQLLLPVSRIMGFLGIRALQASHMKAFINQYYAFRDGLGTYGIFSAVRPSRSD